MNPAGGSSGSNDTLDGRGVRVAVIDSGWDRFIADARIEPGIGFVNPDDDLALYISDDDQDRLGHGTACADLILRLAPAATIVPLRVFGGRLETSVDMIVAALDHATDQGIRLTNLSLGTLRTEAALPLYRACERARRHGMVIVAAAYNAMGSGYPAVFDNVIGVDAKDGGGPFAFRYRTDWPVECTAADVARSARFLKGTFRTARGRSFAAPIIAGWLAKFMSANRHVSLDDARLYLRSTMSTFASSGPVDRR